MAIIKKGEAEVNMIRMAYIKLAMYYLFDAVTIGLQWLMSHVNVNTNQPLPVFNQIYYVYLLSDSRTDRQHDPSQAGTQAC